MMSQKIAKSVLLLLAITWTSSFICGAELVLRQRATISGAMIRLGDVADISARTSSELKNLVTTSLLPTPAIGTQQFLQRSQIVDLLTSRGIETGSLRFSGAKVVEINNRLPGDIPVEKMPSTTTRQSQQIMTAGETQVALEDAIAQYLIDRSSHSEWRVELDIPDSDFSKLTALGPDFKVEGAKHPRAGRQRFRIIASSSREAIPVIAEVFQIHSLIYARRAIVRGNLIRASDVEVRQYEGVAPSLALFDLKQIVGMEARRAISPEMVITENHVRAPILVKRGETVSVYASTGGITVRTTAVARQDGAKGELVQVESLDGKKRYAASVSGNQRLDVYPSGIHVEDFSSQRNKETRIR